MTRDHNFRRENTVDQILLLGAIPTRDLNSFKHFSGPKNKTLRIWIPKTKGVTVIFVPLKKRNRYINSNQDSGAVIFQGVLEKVLNSDCHTIWSIWYGPYDMVHILFFSIRIPNPNDRDSSVFNIQNEKRLIFISKRWNFHKLMILSWGDFVAVYHFWKNRKRNRTSNFVRFSDIQNLNSIMNSWDFHPLLFFEILFSIYN